MIKIIRHIPALFSIAMACAMLNGPAGIGIGTSCFPGVKDSFFTLNYLFTFGVIAYVFLEYWFLDVKSYRFRRFSLWAAALFSLSVMLSLLILTMNCEAILFFLYLVLVFFAAPVLFIVLVVFCFIGKQPKVIEGRFYPAIFSFLTMLWAGVFVGATT